MSTDPIMLKVSMLRDWLKRTGRAQAETGDGYVPFLVAAEALGISQSELRVIRDEDDSPLVFRPMGRGRVRHHWQVELASVAAYLLARDALAIGSSAPNAGSARSAPIAGSASPRRRQ